MGIFKAKGVVYKPVDDVDLGPHSDEFYLRANVKAPRMAGLLVKIFVWFLESRIFGGILLYMLKRNNLIHKLVSYAELEESPVFVPSHPYEDLKEQEVKLVEDDLSPSDKIQKAMECIQCSESIQENSALSFHRWTVLDYSRAYISGEITPLMLLSSESSEPALHMSFFIDYNVGDILRQATESTQRRTIITSRWSPNRNQRRNRLYALSNYRVPRNPYDPNKVSGGSSSGSAAVVSAGLCPVALGVDGGGSVRMPAALCGVVGLKPTFGRVPHSGVIPLNWTVGMVGILAGTVEDAFITSKKINFPLLKTPNCISNIKMAKYGETMDVTIPEIEVMRLAHYSTIGSECSNSIACHLENMNVAEIGLDARVALSVYGTDRCKFHKKIFAMADVIVTPTTGVTAYPIFDDALKTGELDYINGAALVRYQISGNFLGLPAVTIPIGYDKVGLPIGLQFIGKPWSEATLIHIAFAMQAIADSRKPQVFYDLLKKD
ncbi:hypothetical protein HYC85_001950 [Camellia sinensis]|uniref:Amidase domain-containing protein n=1 Tax=Camellia sinensis TaxID=4442 RepID=A0A7J7I840_CAMSI|nr:hypothetical protein HYC85_001950 [Camellia sinensis]